MSVGIPSQYHFGRNLGNHPFSYDANWTVTALIGTLHILIYKIPEYITVIMHDVLWLKYDDRKSVFLHRPNGQRVQLMDLLLELNRVHNELDGEYNVYLMKWTTHCLVAHNVVEIVVAIDPESCVGSAIFVILDHS